MHQSCRASLWRQSFEQLYFYDFREDAEVFPQPEVTDWAEASPDPDAVKESHDE